MEFSKKKLPTEASNDLRVCPIDTVRPLIPMVAPVYVYLRRNAKFVGVKAPLDFFSAQELAKFRPYEMFYLPKCMDSCAPFTKAARSIRALLNWKPSDAQLGALPPAPFELSDAVLRLVGPLWGSGPAIEPFFTAIFATELCGPMSTDSVMNARDQSFDVYERALLRSSWAVFLALHLGYCDLSFLCDLRAKVFDSSVSGKYSQQPGSEMDELATHAILAIPSGKTRVMKGESWSSGSERVFEKLRARMDRVQSELIDRNAPMASVFGPGGFVDV